MQKFLFIHFLNSKQKENNQPCSNVLNMGLSVGLILIALLFAGRQMLGFLSAEPINGRDLLGSLLFIYGALNLIYSYSIREELNSNETIIVTEKNSSEVIFIKKTKKELNILPMVSYMNKNLFKEIKNEQFPDSTISGKNESSLKVQPLNSIKVADDKTAIQETPDEILLAQFYDIEQNENLYLEDVQIDENALPISPSDNEPIIKTNRSKEEKLKDFLTEIL